MQIQKQLNDNNIRYERFDAVNGSELDVHKLSLSIRAESVLRLRKKKTELDIDSMGHIGSYLSHYALWGKCVENKKPCIILEDDIIFCDNFNIRELINYTKNIDFLSLGQEKMSYSQIKTLQLWPEGAKPYVGAWAYMITPRVAEQFIKYAFPIDMGIDFYMQAILSKSFIPFQILSMVRESKLFKTDILHYPLETDPNKYLYLIIIFLLCIILIISLKVYS